MLRKYNLRKHVNTKHNPFLWKSGRGLIVQKKTLCKNKFREIYFWPN